VQGISDLVNAPGLVNVDFADVRTIMKTGGPSIIAMGRGRGPFRAQKAAEQAINAPYLDVTIDGARGVLFNISGGQDMTLHEVRQAASVIRQRADPDVNLIFGATVDDALKGEIHMTLIATGCGIAVPAFPIEPEAIVSEPVPAESAGARAILHRMMTQT
jgi:cell division protein FtsZ